MTQSGIFNRSSPCFGPFDSAAPFRGGNVPNPLGVKTLTGITSADPDFTVVLLPDIQLMTANYPAVQMAIPAWIGANAAAQNIKAVISLGDSVDNAVVPAQWTQARAFWDAMLATGLPCGIGIGNHDYDGANGSMGSRACTNYTTTFPISLMSGQPGYGGSKDGDLLNWYWYFNVGSVRYLVITLEIFPQAAALTWAQTIIDANPGLPTIFFTHSHLTTEGERCRSIDYGGYTSYGVTGNDAPAVWTQFVSVNPQIFLVVNGHHCVKPSNATSSWFPDTGVAGNIVNQLFLNHQFDANGGNGYIGLMRFRPSLGVIDLTCYSVTLGINDPTNSYRMPWTFPVAETGLSSVGPISTTKPLVAGKLRTPGDLKVGKDATILGKLLAGSVIDSTPVVAEVELFDTPAGNYLRMNSRFVLTGGQNFYLTNGLVSNPTATGWLYSTAGSSVSYLKIAADGSISHGSCGAGTVGNAATPIASAFSVNINGIPTFNSTWTSVLGVHLNLGTQFTAVGYNSNKNLYLNNNATTATSAWKYVAAGAAISLELNQTDGFVFHAASSGSAGGALTWSTAATLSSTGALSLTQGIGAWGVTPPASRPTITGSRGSATAAVLASLLTALAATGVITDSTTA